MLVKSYFTISQSKTVSTKFNAKCAPKGAMIFPRRMYKIANGTPTMTAVVNMYQNPPDQCKSPKKILVSTTPPTLTKRGTSLIKQKPR